ncbi:hypothetical protein FQR65_LT11418 [Abscondita terminalis]|nr:hypothetical protein FQR65_LT11418 [Abscondita terminalis]
MSEDTNRLISKAIMLEKFARPALKLYKDPLLYRRLVRSQHAYVQKSTKNPTDNPQNLPKLPVPKIEDTVSKYLTSVRPFLNNDEYCNTERIANEFKCSETTRALQKFLEERASCKVNWLEDWWLNSAYLGYRSPVMIYSSPGQSLPFQEFKSEDDRLCYTSKLIAAAASYIMLIREKKLPIDKQGKNELDMNQYNKIFGTVRVPCEPLDDLKFFNKSEHIVVVHKNHYFKLQLFANCKPLSDIQIYEQLQCVVQESAKKDPPIGVLSADHRDVWAKSYTCLAELNPNTVAEIQQSLFLVCLDDPMPNANYANLQTQGSLQFIHGGGSIGNVGNRWFDKTVQFIVGCNGTVGLTYEHSPSEGQPIAVMVDYLVNFIKQAKIGDIPYNCDAVPIMKLPFQLNDDINKNIKISAANVDKLVKDFQLLCFKFEMYGKEFIKMQKLSPDSYIQMAMQMAFYRMHGVPAAHYESAGTRMYVGGRTETIRSCSVESVAFAQCMLDPCVPDKAKLEALKNAINGHKKYASEAMKGHGVDRHLLGLKLAAQELGCELPELFCDASYTRSTHFRLSTSQVATQCDALMAYGPAVQDGYGLCYNPRKNDINFGLSAWASCPETNVEQFEKCLVQTLCDMQSLLCRNQPSKL